MTYEYECTACQHRWETEQKITAEPERECPECHQETARRLISGGVGHVLKGDGWFKSGGY